MPSSVTSAPHPSSSGPATPRPSPRAAWPVTVGAVLLGWCYGAWVLFAAAINSAPFFGELPTREDNIGSGLVLVTAVLPLALLAVLAVRWGSRWGILLLVAPTLLLLPLGMDWAGNTGNADTTRDPAPDRPIAWSDLGSDLLRPNWVVAAVLALVLVASLVRARRARRTVPGREHPAT